MINPNDPAFSDACAKDGEEFYIKGWHGIGLTKREYFAGLALQGICADSNRNGVITNYAEDAVRLADALIAELNKEPK